MTVCDCATRKSRGLQPAWPSVGRYAAIAHAVIQSPARLTSHDVDSLIVDTLRFPAEASAVFSGGDMNPRASHLAGVSGQSAGGSRHKGSFYCIIHLWADHYKANRRGTGEGLFFVRHHGGKGVFPSAGRCGDVAVTVASTLALCEAHDTQSVQAVLIAGYAGAGEAAQELGDILVVDVVVATFQLGRLTIGVILRVP